MNLRKFERKDNLYPEIFEEVSVRYGKKIVDYYKVKEEVEEDWRCMLVRMLKIDIEKGKRMRYFGRKLIVCGEISVVIYDNLDEKYFKEALKRLGL